MVAVRALANKISVDDVARDALATMMRFAQTALAIGMILLNFVICIGADPDNAKKALSWEACGRVV
jgi:hypothetical protein